MFWNIKYCLVVSLINIALAKDEDPVIETPLGKIRGEIKLSHKGKPFQSFEGIPYAKPPIDNLRFRDPQPIDPWDGIWEAKTLYNCLQHNFVKDNETFGGEDCLYINVYVPEDKPKQDETYDVIVNIHGGGYFFGSGHEFGRPEYIIDRNVILVTFNYRIGALGFLSTGDEIIPGNNGLKDQTLALKWVQSNIHSFGGRKNSITLTGFSAGASSVHLHYFSPLSKGLFHRGLAQSGTAMNHWSVAKNPLKKTQLLAEALGCPTNNNQVLAECLRQRPAIQILEQTKVIQKTTLNFRPVIEKESQGSFLTGEPMEMIKDKRVYDVPLIISNTPDETLAFLLKAKLHPDVLNAHWGNIITSFINKDDNEIKNRANEIKEYYFGKGVEINEKNLNTLITITSDAMFIAGSQLAVKLQAAATKSPVYYYYFNYTGSISFSQIIQEDRPIPGVSHGDDIIHIFPHIVPNAPSETDLKMTDVLLDMLESYTKTSVPKIKNVDWKPNKSTEKLDYLLITSPSDIKMDSKVELGNFKFWKEIGLFNNE